MLLIKRSYGVLQFLNKTHSWPVRLVFALAGMGVVALTTARLALIREMGAQYWNGQFKLASRRVGFYLRAGWPQFEFAFDPFFNFTEDLNDHQLDVLNGWLAKRKGKLPDDVFAGYMLLVKAALAHRALEARDTEGFEAGLARFEDHADLLLQSVKVNTSASAIVPKDIADTEGFAEHAGQVLRDFEKDLPIETWNWFVIGGTFLGMIRDKGFLPHDNDLDVGLFLEGLDIPAFLKAFETSPYFTIAKFDTQTEIERGPDGTPNVRRIPAMLKLVHANGINLDVFLHETRGAQILHGSGVHKWTNDPFTLAEYELEGQKVLGPNPADHYLREHYGEWRVVVKDFSCSTGTTNLAFVKNLHTIALLFKRYAFFAKSDPAEAAKIRRELTQQGYILDKNDRPTMAKGSV